MCSVSIYLRALISHPRPTHSRRKEQSRWSLLLTVSHRKTIEALHFGYELVLRCTAISIGTAGPASTRLHCWRITSIKLSATIHSTNTTNTTTSTVRGWWCRTARSSSVDVSTVLWPRDDSAMIMSWPYVHRRPSYCMEKVKRRPKNTTRRPHRPYLIDMPDSRQ